MVSPLGAGGESASSSAPTVHYPDEQAIANARKGCAEQRALDSRSKPTPVRATHRPPLVRVGSVPVLGATPAPEPVTPADRIIRRGTSGPFVPAPPPPVAEINEVKPCDQITPAVHGIKGGHHHSQGQTMVNTSGMIMTMQVRGLMKMWT